MHPASIPNTPFHIRISGAGQLYKEFGNSLLQDQTLINLLALLSGSIEDTRQEMDLIGVINECADCATSVAGTCCGERTGHKCDMLLLLINLLMGRTIPGIHQDGGNCYFLTPQGCSLQARPVICINFLCARLRKNIEHKKVILLQQIAGREMDALFLVEEHLKKTELLRGYRNTRPAIYPPSSSGFIHCTIPDCEGR